MNFFYSVLFSLILSSCIQNKSSRVQYTITDKAESKIKKALHELNLSNNSEMPILIYGSPNLNHTLFFHNYLGTGLEFELRKENLTYMEFLRAKKILKKYNIKPSTDIIYSSTESHNITGRVTVFRKNLQQDENLAVELALLVFNEIYIFYDPLEINILISK